MALCCINLLNCGSQEENNLSQKNGTMKKNLALVSIFYTKNRGKWQYSFSIFDGIGSNDFPPILSQLGIENDLTTTMEKINELHQIQNDFTKFIPLEFLCQLIYVLVLISMLGVFSYLTYSDIIPGFVSAIVMILFILGSFTIYAFAKRGQKSYVQKFNKILSEEFNEKSKYF